MNLIFFFLCHLLLHPSSPSSLTHTHCHSPWFVQLNLAVLIPLVTSLLFAKLHVLCLSLFTISPFFSHIIKILHWHNRLVSLKLSPMLLCYPMISDSNNWLSCIILGRKSYKCGFNITTKSHVLSQMNYLFI